MKEAKSYSVRKMEPPSLTACTVHVFEAFDINFGYVIVFIFAVILIPKSSQSHNYNRRN